VEAFDHVVVVYIVGLVENHDGGVLNGVSEELMDTVDGSAPGELLADVCRMLAEGLAKDRTGTLAETSDMGVRDKGCALQANRACGARAPFSRHRWGH
jgi:hypothetical protein